MTGRIAFAAAAICVITVLATSCARSGPPGNPDPHNTHLNDLATDPVFHRYPAWLTHTGLELHPARYRDNGLFEPSGWDWPEVEVTLKSTGVPLRQVFAYVDSTARRFGWQPGSRNAWNEVWNWRKRVEGGRVEYLELFTSANSRLPVPSNLTWKLSATSR